MVNVLAGSNKTEKSGGLSSGSHRFVPFFQAKLTVNTPGDEYEQEADAVADQVMRMTDHDLPLAGIQRKPLTISPLQRKCTDCMEEEEDKMLQRKGEGQVESTSEVETVLNATGDRMDEASRSFFETRMGSDFSQVRLHTDTAAARSAQSINALAYTSGNHIVFNQQQYRPETEGGKRLLAHELTHVVQQGKNPALLRRTIQRMPLSPLLPNYAQIGDTCGAASVVAALTIWHNEHRSATQPNTVVATAANTILSYLIHHRSVVIRRIQATPSITVPATDFYATLQTELTSIRDRARTPPANITEYDFQHLGLYLAFIFNSDGRGGMSTFEINDLLRTLHLFNSEATYPTLDEMLDSPILTGLTNDGMAQLNWYAGRPTAFTLHAFIIGRLNDGNWFVYDQGESPPFRIQEPTLIELKMSFLQAIAGGQSWILRTYPAGAPLLLPMPWTGVRLLNQPGLLSQGDQQLIGPNEFLAEIDVSALHDGDRLASRSFVGAEYDLNRAKIMLQDYKRTHTSYNDSGLIIEMPVGVFSVYTATSVSDHNVGATAIDATDSVGGKLATSIYHHAYLLLCSDRVCSTNFFTVY